ncbi:MAG: hypothetical protein QM622_01905 [Microbacterium sp.]
MTGEDTMADAALFRALRHTWEGRDPMPVDLVDRMVAAVATADLTREYALLTIVESAAPAAVRGDADMITLQFSDGRTTVLIHTTHTGDGARRASCRIDGWVVGDAVRVELIQDAGTAAADVVAGRFAFEAVPPGVSRLLVVLAADASGEATDLLTPRFEI